LEAEKPHREGVKVEIVLAELESFKLVCGPAGPGTQAAGQAASAGPAGPALSTGLSLAWPGTVAGQVSSHSDSESS
jgi:hypothetical protein